MPHSHIALIRGINVGTAKRLAMADLRKLVERLGYTDVRTLLNSGNIVFNSPRTAVAAIATRIEKSIVEKLHFAAKVVVLTAAELAVVVEANPLLGVADNPSRLMVAVPKTVADLARLKPLTQEAWGKEVLALGSRAGYLWIPAGIIDSKLATAVGRTLGDAVTTRNWATTLKLHALATGE